MKSRISLFVFIALATVWACITPASQARMSVSLRGPDDNRVDLLVATRTPTRRPPKTPTRRPTRTPLPPLPDFGGSLSFGGGGGCGRCGLGYCEAALMESGGARPDRLVFGTSIKEWNEPSERSGYVCLYGITPDLPFRVRLISPDRKTVLSSNFIYHSDSRGFSWDGNFYALDYIQPSPEGLINSELPILWPVGVARGTWQIYADGAGLQAQGDFDATQVIGDEVNRIQEVAIYDAHSKREILPANWTFVPRANTGTLDVVGAGFTPQSMVYVLVYRQTSEISGQYGIVWDLISKQGVVATRRGLISTKIPGPFAAGQMYMVVSTTRPESLLTGDDSSWNFNFNDDSIGYQAFQVTSSCPGAPPQRMTVNGRGYVCTQKDSVRLRESPLRSASTVVFLPVNTWFDVVGGPRCADNWSWWQIQTDDRVSGWVSEGGDAVDPYFICPSP